MMFSLIIGLWVLKKVFADDLGCALRMNGKPCQTAHLFMIFPSLASRQVYTGRAAIDFEPPTIRIETHRIGDE